MEDVDEEDYTGCSITCTSWVAEDAFFTALLVDKVAKGGWGQIYLGQVKTGPATGDFVAVKVITTGSTITLSKVDELLQRLFNVEASCLVALCGCPEVAQLLATAEVAKYGFSRFCLVLEWMPCGDAQMLLERSGRPLSVEAAGAMLVSVLRALAAAHELGYIHRDVKASNILLGSEGSVQLADWGICGVVPVAQAEGSDGHVDVPGGDGQQRCGITHMADCSTAATQQQGQEPSCRGYISLAPDADGALSKEAGSGGGKAAVVGGSLGGDAHASPGSWYAPPREAVNGDRGPPGGDGASGSHDGDLNGMGHSSAGLHAPAGAPMGTPFWAAPELDAGLPHNQSVDIWSFGITFVELITGRSPYYDTSPEGLAALTNPDIGFMPPGLPEEVLSWLHPCLSVDPAARPTAKQLLQHPFFVRIAQSVDARTLAAAAAQESGDAEAAAEARAPWLVFEHSAAMGYGPSGFTPLLRGSDDGSGSSDGWGGLQLLGTTDAAGDGQAHTWGAGGDAHLAHAYAGADYGHAQQRQQQQQRGGHAAYPHLDPEVVEEMRRLDLLPPEQADEGAGS